MPLSDIAVRNAKPRDTTYKLADEKGMYLEVSPAGGKWWRLKYRFEGKEKRLSLGVYPDISLKEARERRDAERRLIANKIDPSASRQKLKRSAIEAAANTFEAAARKWWLENAPTWSPGYAKRIMSRLEADVFPSIGTINIDVLKPADLRNMGERIRARGVTETARRALQDVGQILIYSDLADISVSQRARLPAYKVQHMAALTEPTDVGLLLRAIDAYSGGIVVRNALKLAPLVFVRPGELRAAKWEDFNLDAAEWRYHVSKTDVDHLVPLSKQAIAILRDLRPVTGHSVYVFPSPRGSRPISENALRVALIAMGFDKSHSAHGFRAMARTILDEVLGYPPHIIEQQLAHSVRDPLGRAYNRTAHLAERRKMMQHWADYQDKLRVEK